MIDDLSLTKLVTRAQAGDMDAFDELFQTYHRKICTYLARMVCHDDQDLAQETFIQAWKKLPELRDVQQFKSWLYRIATNKATSFLKGEELRGRSCQRSLGDEEHTLDEFLSTPGPEERVVEEDWLKQALRALEPQCRACLLLYVVGGFSQREIAALLGIRENTVSGNVCRGREHLRRYRQFERRVE